MFKKSSFFTGLLMTLFLSSCGAQNSKEPGTRLEITTAMGKIKVRLYEDTPKHKANFIKLAKEGFFNGLRFHRVIKEFMIQGGDPNTKDTTKKDQWGMGGPGYLVDAEIKRNRFHKKGALSAARQGDQINPEKKSSGSQFYIVQGKKLTDAELNQIEQQLSQMQMNDFAQNFFKQPKYQWVQTFDWEKLQKENPDSLQRMDKRLREEMAAAYEKEGKPFKFTEEERKIYKEIGGTPFLDTQYTVFGEVEEGMDIVDKIANTPTGTNDRPTQDIVFSVKVL